MLKFTNEKEVPLVVLQGLQTQVSSLFVLGGLGHLLKGITKYTNKKTQSGGGRCTELHKVKRDKLRREIRRDRMHLPWNSPKPRALGQRRKVLISCW